jgi:hypothetical protein
LCKPTLSDSIFLHSVSTLIVCHAPGLAIAGAFTL